MKLITKLIAAAAVCVPMFAHATGVTLMSMPNKAGGLIELTNLACPDDARGGIVRSWDGQTPDSYGCWKYIADTNTISIRWIQTNQIITYNAAAFTPTAADKVSANWQLQ